MVMAKESLMDPIDMQELIARGPKTKIEELRIDIYNKVNRLGIGAQGLGGLTTILEKSLGAMAKAGSTNLVDVLHYAEPVTKKGFVFMDTPGYDPVAATGQVAGGANLVCFTTGRGSVFGCKPAPSIKLATNSPMFKRMEDDMDVNCGTILDGEETVQQCGQRIFDLMLKTASGQPTKSESFDFGGAEFAPWVLGATM